MKRNPESGNALWFILLAAALLAALTVAISRSTDTAEQSGNYERYRIQASDIMRHASSLRETIGSMRLRGMGENQASFEVSFLSSSMYANPNCSSTDCLVYGSAGGGMSYRQPSSDWLDIGQSANIHYGEWEFSGNNAVPGIGTTEPDLIAFVGYLRESLCGQINIMLKVAGGIPTDTDGFSTTSFQGAFTAAGTIDNMDGHEAGCFYDGSNTRRFTFYQVLVKR